MRKIAIAGFKGGIGKTTTCVSLGAGLALLGRRVLLIDTDTQANLSISLGITQYSRSLADVLARKARARDVVIEARKNLDLLPSSISLFKAQQRLVLEMASEEIFLELFADLRGYDYVLLDCAPSVSLMTVNAIVYADQIFVPVAMEMLALAGIKQFTIYQNAVCAKLGSTAWVRLIIPTFYDPQHRISAQVLGQLQRDYGSQVTHPIRFDPTLAEAPGVGQTIYEYARKSNGALDYARLVRLVEELPPA
jgi:chromosome partitioning protein